MLPGGDGCQPLLQPCGSAHRFSRLCSMPRLSAIPREWSWAARPGAAVVMLAATPQQQRETSQECCSWTARSLSFKGCHTAGAPLAPPTPASPPLPGSSFRPRDRSRAHSPAAPRATQHQRMFIFYCANNSKLCEILLAS